MLDSVTKQYCKSFAGKGATYSSFKAKVMDYVHMNSSSPMQIDSLNENDCGTLQNIMIFTINKMIMNTANLQL